MNFDQALDAFAFSRETPLEEIEWTLSAWEETGPLCRKLLADFNAGADTSERTTKALFVVLHLFGEMNDTASFEAICFVIEDGETADLLLGESVETSVAPLLISTFDGRTGLLHRLIESEESLECTRQEALMALCYLTRTGRIAQADTYAYLAGLPDRLDPEATEVLASWAGAVGAMGFAGLAAKVEAASRDGRLEDVDLTEFWEDLRAAQADPMAMDSMFWIGAEPMESAVEWMMEMDPEEAEYVPPALPEPVRNPLRSVGRNDPCPCGSGKKFKKCCGANA